MKGKSRAAIYSRKDASLGELEPRNFQLIAKQVNRLCHKNSLKSWNQKMVASWQESYDKPRQCVEKQRHYSADKGPYSQGYGLPSGHVQSKEMDHKEGPSLAPLMPKN